MCFSFSKVFLRTVGQYRVLFHDPLLSADLGWGSTESGNGVCYCRFKLNDFTVTVANHKRIITTAAFEYFQAQIAVA